MLIKLLRDLIVELESFARSQDFWRDRIQALIDAAAADEVAVIAAHDAIATRDAAINRCSAMEQERDDLRGTIESLKLANDTIAKSYAERDANASELATQLAAALNEIKTLQAAIAGPTPAVHEQ